MHILEEINFLQKNCGSVGIQDIMEDEVLRRACLKSLEIIGEATKNISEDLKEAHSMVKWRRITGMRDKLVHHYFGVDWDIIEDVLKNELPKLRSDILRLLSEMESS
jgi:uncharacterized protein with HEPN domain